jgi:ABC-type nitrate/sulfonate/bicarbonate transport system substrate-binding protein
MRKNHTVVLLLAVLFLLLFGLTEKGQAQVRVRAGYSAISGSMLPLWMAQETGSFQRHGLEAELVFVAGGSKLLQATLGGDFQFAALGGQGVDARLAGADTVYVAGGIDRLVFYLFSSAKIRSITELRNKKVGVTRVGTVSEYAAKTALQRAGLQPPRDAALISVGGIPEIMAAIIAGAVDAGTISPPTSLRARKAGLTELADLSGVRYVQSALLATGSYIERNADIVRRFVRAWTEAIAAIRQDRELSQKVLGKYTRTQDPEVLEETYRAYAPYFDRAPYPPLESIQAVLKEVAQTNPKAQVARPEEFVNPRFVQELERAGAIDSLYRK